MPIRTQKTSRRGAGRAALGALVAALTLSVLTALLCGVGWFRATNRTPSVDALGLEERQALVADLVRVSPGLYQAAYYAPEIGYTLVPSKELSAWGDTFTSNALGYRTGPAQKREGVFRIVLVGDSWTFGMGVREEESFAQVLAGLANEHAGVEREVECWTLALPGYNLHNALAALEFFFERLAPDHVVVVPSGNDNHSTNAVLPNGSHSTKGAGPDLFGDPHPVFYRGRHIDSQRFRARWRTAFARLRESLDRLAARGIDTSLLFLARWMEAGVHAHLAQAGIEQPYAVVPFELTMGPWKNPQPIDHGNAAANRVYARALYRLLAPDLGWAELPPEAELDPHVQGVPVFRGVPAGEDWVARFDALCREDSKRLPSSYTPSAGQLQVAGPSDPTNGLMGRATTILLRPNEGDRRVEVTVRRLADAPSLYPLGLELSVPSPGGGTRARVEVLADAGEAQRFELPIPADLAPRTVLDLVLVAERTVASPAVLSGRSLWITGARTLP